MPVKIRLQRYGKKAHAYYHIVVADGRAPRDGRYIEQIGTYHPGTNPATIDINFDKALSWLQKGAQPTDTLRAILSYKGVMYKKHLDEGIKKGALTQELADAKFRAWEEEKTSKISEKTKRLRTESEKERKERISAESKKREEVAAKVLAKTSAMAEEEAKLAETKSTPQAKTESVPSAETENAPAAETKSTPPAETESTPPAEGEAQS